MSIDKFIQDGQDIKVVEKIYNKIVDMLTHGESINYIALQKKPAVTLLPDSITISNKRIFLCEFTKLGLATNFEIFAWKDIKDIAFKEEIFGSKVTVIPFTGENLSIDYIPKVQARKLYQLIKDALENGKTIIDEQPAPIIVEKTEEKEEPENKPLSVNDMYKQLAQQKKEEEPTPVESVTPHHFESPVAETPKPFVAEITEEEEDIQETIVTPQQHTYVPPAPSYTNTAYTSQPQKEEEEDELTLKLKKLKNLYDKQLITQAEYESKKSEILSQL